MRFSTRTCPRVPPTTVASFRTDPIGSGVHPAPPEPIRRSSASSEEDARAHSEEYSRWLAPLAAREVSSPRGLSLTPLCQREPSAGRPFRCPAFGISPSPTVRNYRHREEGVKGVFRPQVLKWQYVRRMWISCGCLSGFRGPTYGAPGPGGRGIQGFQDCGNRKSLLVQRVVTPRRTRIHMRKKSEENRLSTPVDIPAESTVPCTSRLYRYPLNAIFRA